MCCSVALDILVRSFQYLHTEYVLGRIASERAGESLSLER